MRILLTRFLASLLLLSVSTGALASLPQGEFAPGANPVELAQKPEFLANLVDSFEFIDFYDLLVAMAVGNGTPWKRYDEAGAKPLMDKWRKARSMPLPSDAAEAVRALHTVLAEADQPFRSHQVQGGGDYLLDGPGHQGYYSVTEAEKNAVEGNPYLVAKFKEGAVQPDGTHLWYAKHLYPSAKTFRKFEDKLSAALRADCEAAEAAGRNADESSDEFKSLTPRIIAELIREAATHTELSPAERYRYLISIHPFGDFNGRSLRMWFLRTAGHPLFLTNFDLDLFSTGPDFARLVARGQNQLEWIRQGLYREQQAHPSFPKFYSIVEPWQVAAGIDSDRVDARKLRQTLFDLFNVTDVKQKVQHKQNLEVEIEIEKAIAPLINQLSLKQDPLSCHA